MTGTHTPPPQSDPGAGAIATLTEHLPPVTSDDGESRRGPDVKRIIVNISRVALPTPQ